MIVKENLLKGYSGTYKLEARNKGADTDNYNYRAIKILATLEENQNYTFCFKLKQSNGSGAFSVFIKNSVNGKFFNRVDFNVSDGNSYFNFIYNPVEMGEIAVYSDLAGKTRGVGAEIKDMIIVDGYYEDTGEEIVYLPHKEEVKPDNQAIFPIKGGYHEVFPL